MRQGTTLERLGELDAAEQAYTQAVDARPDLLAPYMSLGHLARIQKDYDSALLRYRQAESVRPDSGEPLHFQGRVFYELGDFETAAKYFDLARQKDPNSAGALYYLALCSYELGDEEEAIGLMRQAMDLYLEVESFTGYPWRWAVILGDWLVEQGELEEARRAFEQALIWHPQDSEIQQRLENLSGD
jgi:tetratricopeptide (TPR) repeat protein